MKESKGHATCFEDFYEGLMNFVDQGSYSPDPDVRVPLGCMTKKNRVYFLFFLDPSQSS